MIKKTLRKSGLFIPTLSMAMMLITCGINKKPSRITTQKDSNVIFPEGEKLSNTNFTGLVWLNYLSKTDTIYNVNIGSVRFEPGSRTNWHYHKGGQILLITDGTGLYQEEGKAVKKIKKGDVIKCPPNIEHWHGATSDEGMTHVAIGTNTNIGGAVWLRPVTDEEYEKY